MTFSNRLFDEIAVGDRASTTRVVTPDDLFVFAHVSGNLNPLNLPPMPNGKDADDGIAAAPSMWIGSLFSAVLGNLLPGPGTIYEAQSLRFHKRAEVGDELAVSVEVTERRAPATIVLATRVERAGALIADGLAQVRAPAERRIVNDVVPPNLVVARHRNMQRMLEACAGLPALPTTVVAPEEENALLGALAGAREGLVKPILIGDEGKIRALASALGADLSGVEIEHAASHDAAAARAVELVTLGRAKAIMKGHLHSDELLRHVVKSQGGLRTSRRISHVFVMDAPSLPNLLLVTDAAINIAPTLEEKVDIVQNAIDLGRALGVVKPKVGVLSAVELVNPKIQSTLDAAALSKMSERGQIVGGVVDGPLAMDNAISVSAARTKGLTSLVAGRADVLVAPNLESGNILAKELTYAAQAEGAGLVLGAKAPVMLTSRADDEGSRLFSCAVAVLYAHWLETGESAVAAAGEGGA
ncbi:bifunctional enoyl-CoA hydratase/phosphate acetyltransferase [Methylocella sp.]|uniref:bifunctional enoyl-CoA hydratase/phosphate acetyltransferase n=1 Tax=Methylocella sp. TaxID=1978226 RepID=UPI0037837D77